MSVGLFDQDMAIYQRLPFNLELMKLSAYYKKARQIVKLTKNFDPIRYGTFHYQKDILDGVYQPDLSTYKNLTYGGLAFSNGIYKPLPLDVEAQKPDTQIYSTYSSNFLTPEQNNFFKSMQNAQHLRLSLDGTTIWSKYTTQLGTINFPRLIYAHDVDIAALPDSWEILNEIKNSAQTGMRESVIGCKFPARFYNAADLLLWTGRQAENEYLKLQFNGLLQPSELKEMVDRRNKKTYGRQFEYVVTYGCSTENQFFMERLPEILKQIIFLRSLKQKISLKYERNFFSSYIGENLITLLECYCNSNFYEELDLKYDSLYSFCKSLHDSHDKSGIRITKGEAREVFQLVRERNYEVFKQFYELHTVEYKGGQLYESNGYLQTNPTK